MCQNHELQTLTFEAVLKFPKACVVLSALNEMLIRVMGTAENQKRKLITVHLCFRSVLHSVPLPVLIDTLHNSLQREKGRFDIG